MRSAPDRTPKRIALDRHRHRPTLEDGVGRARLIGAAQTEKVIGPRLSVLPGLVPCSLMDLISLPPPWSPLGPDGADPDRGGPNPGRITTLSVGTDPICGQRRPSLGRALVQPWNVLEMSFAYR